MDDFEIRYRRFAHVNIALFEFSLLKMIIDKRFDAGLGGRNKHEKGERKKG
jgi:hypothetical protein